MRTLIAGLAEFNKEYADAARGTQDVVPRIEDDGPISVLLKLPEHALENIGRRLPMRSVVKLARACRRLNTAFPAILSDACDANSTCSIGRRIRNYNAGLAGSLFVRRLDEPQLSSIDRWMRAYGFTLTPSDTDVALIELWIARDDNRSRAHSLRLDLSDRSLVQRTIEALGTVHTLDLSCTNVTDADVVALGASGRIHTLDLRCTKITDVGAVALGKVHALNLSRTKVTDVSAIALCTVHTLNLGYTNITDVGAVALGASGRIHTLG